MVTLEVNTSMASLNLSITPNSPSNVDALNYRHFLKKATSANSIELKDLENNATFISAKVNLVPHNFENLDCEIEFLEKIVAIENHTYICGSHIEKQATRMLRPRGLLLNMIPCPG